MFNVYVSFVLFHIVHYSVFSEMFLNSTNYELFLNNNDTSSEFSLLIIGGNNYLSIQFNKKLYLEKSKKIKNMVILDDHYSYHKKKEHHYHLESLCTNKFIDNILNKYNFTHLLNMIPLSNVSCYSNLFNKFQQMSEKPIYIHILPLSTVSDTINIHNDHQILSLVDTVHHNYSLSLVIFLIPELYGTGMTPDMLGMTCIEEVFNPYILPSFFVSEFNQNQLEFIPISFVLMGIMNLLAINMTEYSTHISSLDKNLSLSYHQFKDLILQNKQNAILKTNQEDYYQLNVSSKAEATYSIIKDRIFRSEITFNATYHCKYSTINIINISMFDFKQSIIDMLTWYILYQTSNVPCESECKRSYSGFSSGEELAHSLMLINNSKRIQLCHSSIWKLAMLQSIELTKDCGFVVYTVHLYLELRNLNHIEAPFIYKTCAIAFIHENSILSKFLQKLPPNYYQSFSNWTLVKVNTDNIRGPHFLDERKTSRLPKLSPSLFFASSVKYALYVDGKLELQMHPLSFLKSYVDDNKIISMVALRHQSSETILDESKAIFTALKSRKSITRYPDLIKYQTDYYNYYGDIRNMSYHNVFDGALLLHNLHSTIAKQFRCMWYEEYLSWADRDQIPGPFAITNTMRLSRVQYTNQYNNATDDSILHTKLEYIPIGYNLSLQKFEYIRLLSAAQNHWALGYSNIAINKREGFAFR